MKIEKGIDFTDRGYNCWKSENKPNQCVNHWQKRVESKTVCETNDKLCVNLVEYYIVLNNETPYNSFEVEITAEINGIWWKLNGYSLKYDELDRLEEVEETLIKLINSI